MLGLGWLVETEWTTPLSRKHFHSNGQSVHLDENGKDFVLYIGSSGGNEPARRNTAILPMAHSIQLDVSRTDSQ